MSGLALSPKSLTGVWRNRSAQAAHNRSALGSNPSAPTKVGTHVLTGVNQRALTKQGARASPAAAVWRAEPNEGRFPSPCRMDETPRQAQALLCKKKAEGRDWLGACAEKCPSPYSAAFVTGRERSSDEVWGA